MTVERFKAGEREIVIVGTAHISEESVKLVEKIIREEKPDAVGLELCLPRYTQLVSGKKWQETNITDVVKQGNTYLFLLNIMLSAFQRKIGKQLGLKPGEEMLAASKIAEDMKIPVSLLDRDIKVTLKRAFEKMSLGEKLKLGYATMLGFFGVGEELSREKIEELKKKDVLSALMEELTKEAPHLKEVLVDERDVFIANKILKTPGKTIVAVVGAGHLEGILRHLDRERPIEHLMALPQKNKLLPKLLQLIIPAIIVAAIGYAFFTKGLATSLNVIFWWFIASGIGAFIGVVLARGKLTTAFVSFLTAFLAAVHPIIAVGWIVAVVEGKLVKPKVKDFEELGQIDSIESFTKNKVTHLLVVAALANIGSTIGTIVILPWILGMLA